MHISHQRDDTGGWLSLQSLHDSPVVRRHITEALSALYTSGTRLVIGNQQAAPECVEFSHAAPEPALQQEMERFFLCPLRFGMAQNRMRLSNELLRTELNPFENDFALQLENDLAQQLRSLQEQDSLAGHIRHQLRLAMQHGLPPQRQKVADSLDISVRTLDRRMKEDGISWQTLLDSLRANMARELLTQTELAVPDIGQKLGFSDVRSFQRRFRIWTGMTPSGFRSTQAD